tara:strand:- start:237 stop:725 length:489 start_codon:yes stop_codon:yes gene_type:complete
MEIHLIWAQDFKGGIGKNGKLPWHLSEDLKNFKKITLNSTIIMGRKTWDSLPIKPLPKRKNIVLSRKKQNNIETYHTYEDCLDSLKNLDKVFIIGGRSIYKLFFHDADYLHITKVQIQGRNVNEFFPFNFDIINTKFTQQFEKKLSNQAVYSLWSKNKINNY